MVVCINVRKPFYLLINPFGWLFTCFDKSKCILKPMHEFFKILLIKEYFMFVVNKFGQSIIETLFTFGNCNV